MAYVIVNVGTEMLYRKPGHYSPTDYPTERGAKIACTKLNKSYQGNPLNDVTNPQWVVMSADDYKKAFPVKMVERTNLMSGQKYMEPEDTPSCCSPASETYWCS